MTRFKNSLIVVLFSIFFTAIFYKQILGLNLFLYNVALLAFLVWGSKTFDFRNKTHIAVLSGSLLTSIGTLLHASSMVITMNILSLILLFGVVNNRALKMLWDVVFVGVAQFFMAPVYFFKRKEGVPRKEGQMRKTWRWIGIIIIPLIVFILFFQLYSASSSKFSSTFGFIGKYLNDAFNYFFEHLNFSITFLFIFGFIISCAYFIKTKSLNLFQESSSDQLVRKRNRYYSGRKKALLTEFRIGIIMLASLNILLAIFNIIDIIYVWFGFEWNGELLKEFVHEGTYTLIFTLLISIGLVLIFFRGNLNFFSKNKSLKLLANIWLAQNAVMAISVLIRNAYYIQYYNLAYLRIGVLLFLAIAFFGLITVFIKVNTLRSFFYLFRVNTTFAYLALVLFSCIDWDVVIAKFNFNRSEKAFVHLDFMVTLSDKALPYLDKPVAEVQKIENSPVYQIASQREQFMTSSEYLKEIDKRKELFLKDYPTRSFLEWNLADYNAYRQLSGK